MTGHPLRLPQTLRTRAHSEKLNTGPIPVPVLPDAYVTVVATVRVPAHRTEPGTAIAVDRLRDAVLETLAAQGAVLVPCDWAPDADTITDAIGQQRPVTVIDLNPARQ